MNTMPQVQSVAGHSEERREIQLESSRPVLNDQLLAQYEAMDEGVTDDPLLPKLFGIFQKNIPEHMKRLTIALDKHDEAEVNYLIHKMLGMAHNVGALRLADILMILEQSEIPVKMQLDHDDLTLLNAEYAAAEGALQEHLKGRAH